ncbi:efflux transporter outer membrane subunit [Rhodoferax sp. UBA5149]|uniref:efflux transporter outer membrane subunit n=1 Tax=Rhodoferax sp. UBA5149 TaxID=1947379 RepID=UPI0025EA3AD6|nr:efflux transporter outer membrane subunit [Rhodoferax sp. UBA5149]
MNTKIYKLATTHATPLVLSFLLLGLSGCANMAPYEKPLMEVPSAFKETKQWAAARVQADQVPDDWWRLFKDPTLDQLQADLVLGNQNLKNSVAQYQAARAALGASRASLFPTLGATAGATRGTNAVNGANVTDSYSLGANASWELDLWGRLSSGVEVSQAKLQASQDDLAAARLSLQATLVQTYFSLRTAEAQAASLDSAVAAYQRSLELTQNRYGAGVASAADVAQAQTQLKTTQAQWIETRGSRSQLEHALAVLLGKPPAGFSLPVTALLPTPPDVPLQLPATLMERRPDIAASERRVAAAYAQIGVAHAAYFPALTLSGSAGYRGASLADLISAPNLFWSLGPALALSLFDGGARQAAEDSATAATAQAVAVYRQTVLTALQEVEDNLVIASSLDESNAVQVEALSAAQKALEVVSNQYKAGTVSYLNVVTAQAAALSVERSLLDVRNRRLLALAQLLKNIGGRWNTIQN